jgi:cation diffusion facilitator family transporter
MSGHENHHHTHHGASGESEGKHPHTHGIVDPTLFSSRRGIWAVKWSFLALFATAVFQVVVVLYSGSVALLADTIHNFGDAATAIPLWIAFTLARTKPTRRFTYGLGRVEDLAGVVIVLIILSSALFAGYQSIDHLIHPQPVSHVGAIALASIIGFIGNEWVAKFRIKVGREIASAALIADGYHARVDGLTSLAVLLGAMGVWLGYPLADPIIGFLITLAILRIVWDSSKTVFLRLLDGVDPEVVDEIHHTAGHTPGVLEITEVRVRWSGHQLHAEVNITVDPNLSVEKGHQIATEVRHQLLHQLKYLSTVTLHVDSATQSGEQFHHIPGHTHDNLPTHSH